MMTPWAIDKCFTFYGQSLVPREVEDLAVGSLHIFMIRMTACSASDALVCQCECWYMPTPMLVGVSGGMCGHSSCGTVCWDSVVSCATLGTSLCSVNSM